MFVYVSALLRTSIRDCHLLLLCSGMSCLISRLATVLGYVRIEAHTRAYTPARARAPYSLRIRRLISKYWLVYSAGVQLIGLINLTWSTVEEENVTSTVCLY